jgi:hypothetical protein
MNDVEKVMIFQGFIKCNLFKTNGLQKKLRK